MICEKHNVELECMAGRSAHPSNWYCPACESEQERMELAADKGGSDSGDLLCNWTRAFDGHFNISCDSGERANGNFKGKDAGAKWDFKYCPYCGKKINEVVI